MAKSIITGLGVLVSTIVIVMGVTGVFELTAAGALALGFIGFVFVIFFARFGGVKPFFTPIDPAVDGEAETGATASEDRRSLVGVGADAEASQALFGEAGQGPNQRRGTPLFEESGAAEVSEGEPHTPLFGEALSEQLESEKHLAPKIRFDGSEPVREPRVRTVWQPEPDEVATEEVADDPSPGDGEAEAHAADSAIEAEENPAWVAGEDDPTSEEDDADTRTGTETDGSDTAESESDAALADVDVADDTAHEDEAEVEASADEAGVDVAAESDEHQSDEADDGPSAHDNIDLDDIDTESLVASLDALEGPDPSDPPVEVDYVAEPIVTESTGLAVGAGTDLPVVVETPAPVELHRYTSNEIMAVVKSQESQLVDTLIEEGVLSTDGPLTDKDVRTMVFVAVSSTELIDVLTHAQQDAVALNGGGTHALGSGEE